MKIFACDRCAQVVFFDSSICTACATPLAFFPERLILAQRGVGDRLCRNGLEHGSAIGRSIATTRGTIAAPAG